MSTPHINANKGDFAEVVLMPGDPLRAQYIAETYLENVKKVCDVRNMFGFTGTYKSKSVSVMGHGMGIPSASIYAKELITEFDVKKLIRVGSCGAVRDDIKVRDVVIGMGACTDSGVNRARFNGYDYAAVADFDMTQALVNAALSRNIKPFVGNVFSADLFYTPQPEMFDIMAKMGIVGVEMEAAGLYGVAAEFNAQAACICTVSDHIKTGEQTTSEERQNTFDDMMIIALESMV